MLADVSSDKGPPGLSQGSVYLLEGNKNPIQLLVAAHTHTIQHYHHAAFNRVTEYLVALSELPTS